MNSANHSAPISNVDPAHPDHAHARLVGRWGGGCGRPLVSPACGVYGIQIAIHAIEDQRMQVDVQVRGRAEALDERDGANDAPYNAENNQSAA